ncbi:hypothetical protein PoB_000870100 [Plakobranchus ocellatus]|uniref:Uncharacterized protein n=1 Tax=Plakobranchus ocellatus TaxID=259542 RepID=A0AAV3YIJ6_9GAST|nr:hypothetical protein PoB_000870100 [Plakobranchus ocellatus]
MSNMAGNIKASPHWRQQFMCPTIHVWKYTSFFGQEHIKSAVTFILSKRLRYPLCFTACAYISGTVGLGKGGSHYVIMHNSTEHFCANHEDSFATYQANL